MTKLAPGPPWAGLVGYEDADVDTPTFCSEQPLSPGYADLQVPPFFVLLVGFKKCIMECLTHSITKEYLQKKNKEYLHDHQLAY